MQLLVADENVGTTEVEFRKALELLAYVDKSDDARRKIWCAAILRDNWDVVNVDSPLEEMQNMLFFKLVELCFFIDADLAEVLPPMDQLMGSYELSNLSKSKSFQFLFKLGYEYIGSTYM